MKAPETIDLDDPKDAKKYLRGTRVAGAAIEYVETKDGKKLSIESMDDKQLVFYAKEGTT